jgi:hypothetical protein
MKIDDIDFDSPATGPLTGVGALVAAVIFLGGALLVKIFGDDDKPDSSQKK